MFQKGECLGVWRIREFNLALLGKWCLRMRVEKSSLWYKVLVARYWEAGGIIAEEGKFKSVWWNNLILIKNASGGIFGLMTWF